MRIIKPLLSLHLIVILVLTFVSIRTASAIELASPETLMTEYGLKSQDITVIEPHESKPGHDVIVGYQALFMTDLLA